MPSPLKYKAGDKVGRLTVLSREGSYAVCLCECGNTKRLKACCMGPGTGKTQSCGCLRKEMTVARSLKHGASRRGQHTGTYACWAGMLKRCTSPGCKAWANYGGRGIIVCERWVSSFANFLADMGERPDGLTIERIDNDGNYEPGNCRWATRDEQQNNTRANHLMTHQGRTQTMAAWCRETGLCHTTIIRRLNRGMTDSQALQGGRRHAS